MLLDTDRYSRLSLSILVRSCSPWREFALFSTVNKAEIISALGIGESGEGQGKSDQTIIKIN